MKVKNTKKTPTNNRSQLRMKHDIAIIIHHERVTTTAKLQDVLLKWGITLHEYPPLSPPFRKLLNAVRQCFSLNQRYWKTFSKRSMWIGRIELCESFTAPVGRKSSFLNNSFYWTKWIEGCKHRFKTFKSAQISQDSSQKENRGITFWDFSDKRIENFNNSSKYFEKKTKTFRILLIFSTVLVFRKIHLILPTDSKKFDFSDEFLRIHSTRMLLEKLRTSFSLIKIEFFEFNFFE